MKARSGERSYTRGRSSSSGNVPVHLENNFQHRHYSEARHNSPLGSISVLNLSSHSCFRAQSFSSVSEASFVMSRFYIGELLSQFQEVMLSSTNLIKPRRMRRITIDLFPKLSQHPQLGIVATQMDIESLDIIRGASVPLPRVHRDVISARDRGRLPEPRCRRAV